MCTIDGGRVITGLGAVRDDGSVAHGGPDGIARPRSDSTAYLAHVDGLRAIAILLVVVYHAWPGALTGGFVGVDVFFVISGFLITRLMLAEMAAGTFSLSAFLARRVRRLLPAAAVMIAGVLVAGAFILLPETYAEFGRSVIAALLMYANVLFYRTAGYFSAPAGEKPLLHTWSLSVEDQFYLTWPLLLIVLAPRLPRAVLAIVAAVLALASFIHAERMVTADPDFAFYILFPRAWELLAGCLLAIAVPWLRIGAAASQALGVSGLVTIVASAVLLSAKSHFPGSGALPAVVGTAMVIAAGFGEARAGTVVRLLSSGPAVFVGLISYSLYLWHWPILSLAEYAASRPLTGVEPFAAVALSLLLAVLSWRYVERPFRLHGAIAIGNKVRTFAAATLVAIGLGGAGGAIHGLDGLPQRFSGVVGKLFTEMAEGNPLRSFCDGRERAFVNDSVCNFGRRKRDGESYDLAVFGDSNADHFVPMVAQWADREAIAGRQVTQSMCGPLLGVAIKRESDRQNAACRSYQQAVLDFVAANPGLKIVVLAGAWTGYHGDTVWNGLAPAGSPRLAEVAGNDVDFARSLAETVSFFRRRGIRVHLIGQVPHFRVLPARCAVKALIAGADPAVCGLSAAEVRARHAMSDNALTAAAASDPGVTATLMSDVMCDAARCSPMKDGVFLYRDIGHLSGAGSRLLARHVSMPAMR